MLVIRWIAFVIIIAIIVNVIQSERGRIKNKRRVTRIEYVYYEVSKRHDEMIDAGRYVNAEYVWIYVGYGIMVVEESFMRKNANFIPNDGLIVAYSTKDEVQFMDDFEEQLDV